MQHTALGYRRKWSDGLKNFYTMLACLIFSSEPLHRKLVFCFCENRNSRFCSHVNKINEQNKI